MNDHTDTNMPVHLTHPKSSSHLPSSVVSPTSTSPSPSPSLSRTPTTKPKHRAQVVPDLSSTAAFSSSSTTSSTEEGRRFRTHSEDVGEENGDARDRIAATISLNEADLHGEGDPVQLQRQQQHSLQGRLEVLKFAQEPLDHVHIGEPTRKAQSRYTNGTASRKGKGASSYVVFSGGTAANDFVAAFRGEETSFVLPVSDDGGSSSEILRVLGGPSIGDIRSRLIRLIPRTNTSSQSTPILTPIPDAQSNLSRDSRYPHHYDEVGRGGEQAERARGIQAVHDLFGHRFDATCSEREARDRWMELVEGRSRLWEGVPEDRKECIRSFFVHFNTLILRRAHKRFSFRNCSVGNVFIASARDMLGGLPGAIFMFKAVTDSQGTGDVIPVILTNQRITIAAEMENGRIITGQCEISHPAPTPTSTTSVQVIHKTKGRLSSISTSTSASTTPTRAMSSNSRRRKDSMSFSTVESSDEDSASSSSSSSSSRSASSINHHDRSNSFPPSTTLSIDSDTDSVHLSSRVPVINLTAAPGSPWRDSARSLPQAQDQPPAHHRKQSIKRVVSTQSFDELEPQDTNSLYVKGGEEVPLDSKIERIFYLNVYGQEILPDANAEVLKVLGRKSTLVYSCGSLWTSIIPCLSLRGMASAIARSPTLKYKVLLLNSTNDRETTDYVASDYIQAIVRSLNRYDRRNKTTRSNGKGGGGLSGTQGYRFIPSRLITHIVYLEGGKVVVDEAVLTGLGVGLIRVPASKGTKFTTTTVEWALNQIQGI